MADERFVVVLEEARRALDRQAQAVEELRARAAALLTAGSIGAAFLGGLVFADDRRVGAWGWTSVVLFGALGVSAGAVLWPRTWVFVSNARQMVRTYVTEPPVMTIDQMRWHLAERIDERYVENELKRRWMRLEVAVGVLLVVGEILAMLIELAGLGRG